MENQITVTDLAQIKAIIETACTRGAFQAPEMRTVGEVYERLSAFLQAVVDEAESARASTQGETQ